MTRREASEFPVLARVFSGYLHEDLVVMYGGPETALRAFRGDATPEEWRRFQVEARRLVERADGRDDDDIRRLVQRLGSRWIPPSRDALITLLTEAANSEQSDRR
jgi:hypothetical protein